MPTTEQLTEVIPFEIPTIVCPVCDGLPNGEFEEPCTECDGEGYLVGVIEQ